MKNFFTRWLISITRTSSATSEHDTISVPAENTALNPDPIQTAKHLAIAGKFKQAIALLAPIATHPNASPSALIVLGNSYLLNGEAESAIKTLERAQALQPSNPAIALNLANALRDSGDIANAQLLLETLLSHNHYTAEALDLLGVLRLDNDDPTAAIQFFDRALALAAHHTKARYNRACALLTLGRSTDAWIDHELRAAASYRAGRPITSPSWRGESVPEKSMFIYAEQGIGEEILFASCFEHAAAQATHCTIECSTKLHRLFCDSFPQIHFLARNWHNDRELPAESAGADIVTAAGSLLRWFRPDPTNSPPLPPYLVTRRQDTQHWREQLTAHGAGPFIGLCWRGGTRFTRQRFRSLSPRELGPLFAALPQATFISLLPTATEEELSQLQSLSGGRVLHFPEPLINMADTAALMSALDLTISIPTTVVYLASALGVPVWACTTRGAGWKYGYNGDQSMWLPGARLFRQQTHFDWAEVIHSVAAALPQWQRNRP